MSLKPDLDYFTLEKPLVSNLSRTELAFRYCAWNILLYDLRTCPDVNIFKKKLKTHLFTKDFWYKKNRSILALHNFYPYHLKVRLPNPMLQQAPNQTWPR